MPNFVSGSSGHIYSHGKLSKKAQEEDEIAKYTKQATNADGSANQTKKPSAINKKGEKDGQKSSLDLFKEELRRLNEERDEQRNRLKKSITGDKNLSTTHVDDSEKQSPPQQQKTQTPICIPLKPDPRCPTTLTLQVNLNPKDKDASINGSFDMGDPTTTNLYLGNLNPSVNENDLCDIFGKFGPLASIKVMWPRTDEERARNRNSGFVAYMSRIDAERALRTLNGMDIRGHDLKLGWGKAVPLPQNPVFIPPDLVKLLEPPPQTGLPFNAQLDESDIRRKYRVPNPPPKPAKFEHESELKTNVELRALKETYDDYIDAYKRSTVRVVIPQDRQLLDRIHKTIEYVIREGPVFEAIIIARENKNPDYKFLYDNRSYEHVYYRWKLYSILHGDDPYKWRTCEFRMFQGGPLWKPPPLNPFADGMPVELIEKSTGVNREILLSENSMVHSSKSTGLDVRSTVRLHLNLSDTRQKGSLGATKRLQLEQMLSDLKPTKSSLGIAMMFCINHSDAAKEVIDCIRNACLRSGLPLARKVALIFLISDVLHNCSAAVTNASFYRQGFQDILLAIFEDLREYLSEMIRKQENESNKALAQQKSDNFKQKILSVLGAWREWTLYEDEFIINLSDILLGISADVASTRCDQATSELDTSQAIPNSNLKQETEDNLDGEQLDEAILIKCLEDKGLSLRWYKTLELSDDELDDDQRMANNEAEHIALSGREQHFEDTEKRVAPESSVKFKTSKWETVDPNDVAEQVVRLSKWEAIEKAAQKAEEVEIVATSVKKQRFVSPSSSDERGGSPVSSSRDEVEYYGETTAKRLHQSTKRVKRQNDRDVPDS